MERLKKVVKVTRRGQTTIPVEFRRRHNIKEGSRLLLEDRGEAMLIRPVPQLEDMGGYLAKVGDSSHAQQIDHQVINCTGLQQAQKRRWVVVIFT